MGSSVIAFLSDFGLSDPYVGMVKAVINRINPDAKIIDITHEVPKYRVDVGALILKTSYKYFRKGTTFLAVVDPEVGTSRKGVILVSKNYVFVGPNNGLLLPASLEDGLESAYEIDVERVRMWEVSKTFHGRDVFAPTAALISLKTAVNSLGKPLPMDELVRIEIPPKDPVIEGGYVVAEAFYVDSFGNVILSQTLSSISKLLGVKHGDEVIIKCEGGEFKARVVSTFAEVCEGCVAVYEDSLGLAEVGVFKGNASKALGVGEGDLIRIGKVL
ncbi:MAG: SAM-dependent chlorinase/fluorinase [Sulfolobales archaeon]